MPYDESLAASLRRILAGKRGLKEKKMFGGVCFLLNGSMLVGVWKEFLIVRLGTDQGEVALREPHVRKMDITGKPMRGWIMVEPEGMDDDSALKMWVQRAVKFVKTLPEK